MYILAKNYEKDPVPLSDISRMTDLSDSYLEQLIRRLKKNGFVDSIRGSQGGYFLTRSPYEISIGEILRSLEDFFGTTECSAQNGYCNNEKSCPTRDVWIEISNAINDKVDSMNLGDLVDGKYKL